MAFTMKCQGQTEKAGLLLCCWGMNLSTKIGLELLWHVFEHPMFCVVGVILLGIVNFENG